MRVLLHPPYLVRMCKLNNAYWYKQWSALLASPRLVLCKISLGLISETVPMHGSDTELVREKLRYFLLWRTGPASPHWWNSRKHQHTWPRVRDRFLLLFVIDLPASFPWLPQRFGCYTYESVPCIICLTSSAPASTTIHIQMEKV